LRAFLDSLGHSLQVVEIAGKGFSYFFAGGSVGQEVWWSCLYPETGMENIVSSEAVAKVLIASGA